MTIEVGDIIEGKVNGLTKLEEARKATDQLMDEYENEVKYEKACKILDEGLEDAFQYTNEKISKRLITSNLIERLNEEIRRRERVVRIFPNISSANRLIGAILMDINEEWISSGRKYITL